jgi:hypothetical protein
LAARAAKQILKTRAKSGFLNVRNLTDTTSKRFAVIEELGKPKLMGGMAKKKDVFAYFNGRKEKEIVIDPDKVTKVKTLAVAFDPEDEIE